MQWVLVLFCEVVSAKVLKLNLKGAELPKPYKYFEKEGRYPTARVVKMERLGLCFMVGLLCVWGASAQNHTNMTFVPYSSNTSFPYSSGSGIGSGEFPPEKLQLKFYKSALLFA